MRKLIFLSSLFILSLLEASCQSGESFNLSKEIIIKKNSNITKHTADKGIRVKGISYERFVLYIKDTTNNRQAYLFDESKQELYPFKEMKNETGNKLIDILVLNDIILKIGYYNVPEHYNDTPIDRIPIDKFEYQDFWIQYKEKNIKIDSFPYHYIDKYICCNFSDDGKKLLCNPYTTVSAGYSPDIDNRIYLYNLQAIESGKIEKQIIPCERCLNNFIVNGYYFFNKEIPIGGGFDGFYRNIYKAPLDNIKDTVRVAHDIELVTISPDGKYILGQKYLYGRFTPVILNTETKQYQYILGRNYPFDNVYYSVLEEKFAFDFGEHLVYIEFPQEFPFDALENITFRRSTKAENEAFWEKYKHEPLP